VNSMNTYIPSAFDNTSLSQLREDAKVDPDAKADEVSRQFEALFVNMLLKSMRKATQRSELFNSEAAKSFESMFDQEIANKVSYADGIGLADTIKRQLFSSDAQKLFKSGGFDTHQRAKAHAINSYQNQTIIPRRIERD
jgi:flagellar protein FlgJ